MTRVYVVVESNRDDPANTWVVDLDKFPSDSAFVKAVLTAVLEGDEASIRLDDSLSYGNHMNVHEVMVSLPAHVEGVVILHTDGD